MEQAWKDISARMQMDLETFSKLQGDRAGALTQNLQAVNRETYDYTAFLKKFAVRGEVMRLDPDEFDYVYYTYGLKLYRNMPLIEPLEYREVKRIREFVIAIDTSGSTSGELVQKFVQKTYNVLKSTESFFSKINLHILQCDADIQEDVKITSQEEFDAYLKTMTIKGLGGHRLPARVRLCGRAAAGEGVPESEGPDLLHRRVRRLPGEKAGLRRRLRLCGGRVQQPRCCPPGPSSWFCRRMKFNTIAGGAYHGK